MESLKHPIRTGAIVSTARHCVTSFLDGAQVDGAGTVVELGAGTGAITERLRSRMPAGADLIAVEVSEALAERLRVRCPEVQVACASALDLAELLREREVPKVDRIVCSIPWTLLHRNEQHALLDTVTDVLAPDGRFSMLLAAHRVRGEAGSEVVGLLGEHFAEVQPGPTWWANLPPLRAVHCSVQ